MTLPFSTGRRLIWLSASAIFLLLLFLNWSRILSLVYQNLAARSFSIALTTDQAQLLPQAEGYVEQAISYNRQLRGSLTYRLGVAKQQLGLTDAAFVNFQTALDSNTLSDSLMGDLLFRIALHAMEAGEVKAAAGYFQRLLAMDSTQLPVETVAHANVYLGLILGEESGDLLLERQYLERALDLLLDPLTMDRYLGLITQMLDHGGEEYLQQALEMATYATAKQPSSTWPALLRCNAHAARAELAEATTWCQRSLALGPENPHARVAMGNIYARQGLWQEALVEYEMAATLDPDNNWYRTLIENAQASLR